MTLTAAELYRDYTETYDDYSAAAITFRDEVASVVNGHGWVAARAKTPTELYKKQRRKRYQDPWVECTDLVGVRVVVPLLEDKDAVVQLLSRSPRLRVERIEDQRETADPLQLRYSGLHVHAAIDGLADRRRREIHCEIQIRTEAEHAWSSVEHMFVYKKPIAIPAEAQRTFSRLLSLVELLDIELSRGVEMVRKLPTYVRFQNMVRLQELFGTVWPDPGDDELTMENLELLETVGAIAPESVIEALSGYVPENAARISALLSSHGSQSDEFDPDRDWILTQPEVLIICWLMDTDDFRLSGLLAATELQAPGELVAVLTDHTNFLRE